MIIEVPDQIESRLSPQMAALNLAVGLYASEEVTLEQAAAIAKLSQSDLLKELGKRQIPFHYGIQEFEEDLATIDRLNSK